MKKLLRCFVFMSVFFVIGLLYKPSLIQASENKIKIVFDDMRFDGFVKDKRVFIPFKDIFEQMNFLFLTRGGYKDIMYARTAFTTIYKGSTDDKILVNYGSSYSFSVDFAVINDQIFVPIEILDMIDEKLCDGYEITQNLVTINRSKGKYKITHKILSKMLDDDLEAVFVCPVIINANGNDNVFINQINKMYEDEADEFFAFYKDIEEYKEKGMHYGHSASTEGYDSFVVFSSENLGDNVYQITLKECGGFGTMHPYEHIRQKVIYEHVSRNKF